MRGVGGEEGHRGNRDLPVPAAAAEMLFTVTESLDSGIGIW